MGEHEIQDTSNIPRYRKPSVTIEFEYYTYKGDKRIKSSAEDLKSEEQEMRILFRNSGYFSRLVKWRKTSDILISIELIKKERRSNFWQALTTMTLFVLPNVYTIGYELHATVYDDLHQIAKDYSFEEGFVTVEHILMLPVAALGHPALVDKRVRHDLYKALLAEIYADKIVGGS